MSIKKFVEYSPKQIDRRVHLSINYRKNWTELLQLYMAVQNANQSEISSEFIIKSLIELKLYPEVAIEVEKITQER